MTLFENALGYSLLCKLETYHQLVREIDCFQTYKFIS